MNGMELRRAILARASELGFDKVGFARASLDDAAPRLTRWLERGHHGEMKWMEREPGKRSDASLSLPGARTVVCCAVNYYQGRRPTESLAGVIATYAGGEDYHRVIGRKLDALAEFIGAQTGVSCKIYVDTGPVLEKSFAAAAGLGWMGKHSNLLARDGSSWFFLGEILVPVELPVDEPVSHHCGTCSRCIEACPTRAIIEPYVVDSRRCISYLTIELRGAIPKELRSSIGNRIYGCDDCQDVCPWNKFARKSDEAAFFAREPLRSMDLVEMLAMSRDEFLEATRRSAIRRARYGGFLRNVAVALGNSGDPRAVPALVAALDHEEPLVRSHAAWGLAELEATAARSALESRASRETDEEVRAEIGETLERLDAHFG